MVALNKPAICPIVIGRAADLTALHTLVDQVKNGKEQKGQVVLISGEAGIGKSRLVTEAKTYAASQDFLLFQGNCFPTDLLCPYAPILDLLRSLLTSNQAPTLPAAIENLARDIFPLLPELVPDQTILPSPLEPEQEKRRLFAVLTKFFINVSMQSPILLIIEDIHWSDTTSLDFLHYLARRSASHPILLLVTYRPDIVRAELRGWLAQLARERLAQEVQLKPLSRDEVDTMLSAIFDQRHTAFDMRRFLHGELLDTLYTLTEGNPFFVEETLSAMIAAGDIFYVQGYWNRKSLHTASIPQSIQDAVQPRTQHLGEAAKQVLTLAAVAGRHFDFALLQQLTGYDEEQLLLVMKELVSAQLVVEVSTEQFAFRHALTRRAIYTQLLARERTRVHHAIAETIEQLPPAALDGHLENLAYHFYQAEVWQKTLDYAQRAGEKALRLYSHRAAIDYFTWALEAADHLSLLPTPASYRARGQAYETLGEFEQAQHDYTCALDAARVTNDRVAEWQSAIDLGFLWAGRDYAQAEIWFRQALILSQSLDDPALHARSLNRIGNWHLNVEQPHEALRYHQQALAIFQQLHDSHGIAETLDLLGMTSYVGGDLVQGTAYYEPAVDLFRELDDRQGLTSSLATMTLRGVTYQTETMISASTNLDEVVTGAELALKIAHEIGQRSAEAYALFLLGDILGPHGEYARALEYAQKSLEIAEAIEHRQWITAAHCVSGGLYRDMLDLYTARQHFEQALATAKEIGSFVWIYCATGYLATTCILQNELEQAESVLSVVLIPDTSVQTLGQRLAETARAELALARRNPTLALQILDRLFTSAANISNQRGIPRLSTLRAEALIMLDRQVEAETLLIGVRDQASSQELRSLLWHVHLLLGTLYQSQHRHEEAESSFSAAQMLIEQLAANIPDESLRDHFLSSAIALIPRSRLLSPRQTAKNASGGLTEREREVAILIAQGQSNQAIADTLVVTKRTVETHIGNIMFKLGCTSRTQIAVWAVETGLASRAETESTK